MLGRAALVRYKYVDAVSVKLILLIPFVRISSRPCHLSINLLAGLVQTFVTLHPAHSLPQSSIDITFVTRIIFSMKYTTAVLLLSTLAVAAPVDKRGEVYGGGATSGSAGASIEGGASLGGGASSDGATGGVGASAGLQGSAGIQGSGSLEGSGSLSGSGSLGAGIGGLVSGILSGAGKAGAGLAAGLATHGGIGAGLSNLGGIYGSGEGGKSDSRQSFMINTNPNQARAFPLGSLVVGHFSVRSI